MGFPQKSLSRRFFLTNLPEYAKKIGHFGLKIHIPQSHEKKFRRDSQDSVKSNSSEQTADENNNDNSSNIINKADNSCRLEDSFTNIHTYMALKCWHKMDF